MSTSSIDLPSPPPSPPGLGGFSSVWSFDLCPRPFFSTLLVLVDDRRFLSPTATATTPIHRVMLFIIISDTFSRLSRLLMHLSHTIPSVRLLYTSSTFQLTFSLHALPYLPHRRPPFSIMLPDHHYFKVKYTRPISVIMFISLLVFLLSSQQQREQDFF